jgi:hypothetical protein
MSFVFNKNKSHDPEDHPFVSRTRFTNDPALYVPVKIRVLRSFMYKGRSIEAGTVTAIPKVVADDMCAIKKAERL